MGPSLILLHWFPYALNFSPPQQELFGYILDDFSLHSIPPSVFFYSFWHFSFSMKNSCNSFLPQKLHSDAQLSNIDKSWAHNFHSAPLNIHFLLLQYIQVWLLQILCSPASHCISLNHHDKYICFKWWWILSSACKNAWLCTQKGSWKRKKKSEANKANYQANISHIKSKQRIYYHANCSHIRYEQRIYYRANKTHIKNRKAVYHQKKRESRLQQMSLHHREKKEYDHLEKFLDNHHLRDKVKLLHEDVSVNVDVTPLVLESVGLGVENIMQCQKNYKNCNLLLYINDNITAETNNSTSIDL